MASFQSDRQMHSSALTELRYEIADVKHTLHNTQIEFQLLEEQVKKTKNTSSSELDKKIKQLEDSQRKATEEIRQLSKYATQTGLCLSEYKTKITELEKALQQQHSILGEISHLKSNLVSIAQSLQKESSQEEIYRVRSGDSLEKIARMHKITLKQLQEANHLSHDKIRIGQELIIPFSE